MVRPLGGLVDLLVRLRWHLDHLRCLSRLELRPARSLLSVPALRSEPSQPRISYSRPLNRSTAHPVVPVTASLALANAALSPAIFVDVGIAVAVLVPMWTVSFSGVLGRASFTAENILCPRHNLKMQRVAAGAVATQVIQRHPRRNRPVSPTVPHESMQRAHLGWPVVAWKSPANPDIAVRVWSLSRNPAYVHRVCHQKNLRRRSRLRARMSAEGSICRMPCSFIIRLRCCGDSTRTGVLPRFSA